MLSFFKQFVKVIINLTSESLQMNSCEVVINISLHDLPDPPVLRRQSRFVDPLGRYLEGQKWIKVSLAESTKKNLALLNHLKSTISVKTMIGDEHKEEIDDIMIKLHRSMIDMQEKLLNSQEDESLIEVVMSGRHLHN